MPAAQKLPDGRWTGRYRTPDGRHHRTSAHATAAEALLAAVAENGGRPYVFAEGEGDDSYYVGRYLTPEGWRETEDGFDDPADALAEACELAEAARAGGVQPGA